jgi:hypothetical protein
LLFFLSLAPLFGGLLMFWLRRCGLSDEFALPIGFLSAAFITVCGIAGGKACIRALERRFDRDIERKFAAALKQARESTRRFGYRPLAEGGSQRHRVTISRITAIWPVDDLALEDLGPGYVLRTAENEHIYCAGQAFLDSEEEGFTDGVFHLAETLILELGGDLQYIETVKCQGRRVPVTGDEVPSGSLPTDYYMVSFAILDDPEIIRRLPPIPAATA